MTPAMGFLVKDSGSSECFDYRAKLRSSRKSSQSTSSLPALGGSVSQHVLVCLFESEGNLGGDTLYEFPFKIIRWPSGLFY